MKIRSVGAQLLHAGGRYTGGEAQDRHAEANTSRFWQFCSMCVSCNDTHIATRYVILAKHWMWLPDDGFI